MRPPPPPQAVPIPTLPPMQQVQNDTAKIWAAIIAIVTAAGGGGVLMHGSANDGVARAEGQAVLLDAEVRRQGDRDRELHAEILKLREELATVRGEMRALREVLDRDSRSRRRR